MYNHEWKTKKKLSSKVNKGHFIQNYKGNPILATCQQTSYSRALIWITLNHLQITSRFAWFPLLDNTVVLSSGSFNFFSLSCFFFHFAITRPFLASWLMRWPGCNWPLCITWFLPIFSCPAAGWSPPRVATFCCISLSVVFFFNLAFLKRNW